MVGNYLCFSQLGLRESSWVEACHGAISRRLGIEQISIIPRFEIPFYFSSKLLQLLTRSFEGKIDTQYVSQ